MKVAVSSSGKNLDSQIDPRFGRSVYFLIIDTEDMSYEAFENENTGLSGGAGIQTASFVSSKGAEVVITGNCGPKAAQVLSEAGIQLVVGQSGTVREAVENFKKGIIKASQGPNVSEKFGIGPEVSQQNLGSTQTFGGTGRGGGRGMGGGGGRGMGGGGGRGMGGGGGGCRRR